MQANYTKPTHDYICLSCDQNEEVPSPTLFFFTHAIQPPRHAGTPEVLRWVGSIGSGYRKL